jgi:flavin-dependent trigonelline monooxygenase, oxygenase component
MKFSLAINMERMSPDLDMREVARHTLEMVQMADEGGFEIAWAAEHHAIEMTIAPAPFPLLAWWAAHTSRIRLGTAVVVAPYWHPIKVAGEAAMLDLLSGGRLNSASAAGLISANSTAWPAVCSSRSAWRTCRKCCRC